MADYWVSNERKYCDFCQCWIAQNKVSVNLHENGKRHKENVAKKITAINKKSSKDFKDKIKVEDEMSKMEKNAMAAYLKDIENNADLTSQIINEKLAEANSKPSASTIPSKATVSETSTAEHSKKSKWQEAKSDDGHIYYWNTETNEAVWEPPPEGFVSIADLKVTNKKSNFTPKGGPPKGGKKPFQPSKKPKVHTPKAESSSSLNAGQTIMGPEPRGAPYGSWVTVNNTPSVPVDYQLPAQKQDAIPTVQVSTEPQEKKFKEKQMVTSVEDGCGSSVEFKKRKFNNNARRNTRQRLDDD